MIQTKPRGRPATAHEINAGEMRAKRNDAHVHAYFQHRTLPSHMGCPCGWICRRDMVPADLVFCGPARPR